MILKCPELSLLGLLLGQFILMTESILRVCPTLGVERKLLRVAVQKFISLKPEKRFLKLKIPFI